MRVPRLSKIAPVKPAIEPTDSEKQASFKAKGMAKIKGTSTTYDHNRPRRQVITRYTR